jgi:hypothetical protein
MLFIPSCAANEAQNAKPMPSAWRHNDAMGGSRLFLTTLLARMHRTLAVPLCLLLALWFATGTVLSFVDYPSLGSSQRLARMERVAPAAVLVAPAAAIAASGFADARRLRLVAVGGAPRYLVAGEGERQVAVDARTGLVLPLLDAGAAGSLAARAEGLPVARVVGPFDYDLWTVHDKYRIARPWFRVEFADAARTELYVSALTGEPMQRTQGRERLWNRLGATLHWLNVPVLRAHIEAWRWTVWVLALGGIVLALLGLVLGWLRWRAQQRTRRKGFSPFRGLMRWHHMIGAGAGLLLLSWVTSGWLSLEATGWFSPAQPSALQQSAWAGMPLEEAARRMPLAAVRALPPASEYEWRAIAGEPLLLVRGAVSPGAGIGSGAASVQVWSADANGSLQPGRKLSQGLLAQAVGAAWPGLAVRSVQPIAANDSYALRGAPFPADALRFELDDKSRTWVHVDGQTGEVLGVMDRSRRTYRWLVDGLHTFDFPWLNRGGLWHWLLVCCTSAGFTLSLTGTVLATRRLRRGNAFS